MATYQFNVISLQLKIPESHKGLVDRICSDLGIKSILPIWNCNSEQIVADLIDAGFDAIVISAKADLFGDEWLTEDR